MSPFEKTPGPKEPETKREHGKMKGERSRPFYEPHRKGQGLG